MTHGHFLTHLQLLIVGCLHSGYSVANHQVDLFLVILLIVIYSQYCKCLDDCLLSSLLS